MDCEPRERNDHHIFYCHWEAVRIEPGVLRPIRLPENNCSIYYVIIVILISLNKYIIEKGAQKNYIRVYDILKITHTFYLRATHIVIMFRYHYRMKFKLPHVLACDHSHYMHPYARKCAFTPRSYLAINITSQKNAAYQIRSICRRSRLLPYYISGPRCLMPCNCSILLHRRGLCTASLLL